MIAEDAGRDASFQSPYLEQDMIGSSPRGDAYIVQFNPARNVPTGQRRYWRWADADGSFGVSTQPNNKARPMKTNGFYLPPDKTIEGNNCGANDEAFSFHPGGVNVLMGDGSARFIKESINIVTWRSLISRAGGEVISVRSILRASAGAFSLGSTEVRYSGPRAKPSLHSRASPVKVGPLTDPLGIARFLGGIRVGEQSCVESGTGNQRVEALPVALELLDIRQARLDAENEVPVQVRLRLG